MEHRYEEAERLRVEKEREEEEQEQAFTDEAAARKFKDDEDRTEFIKLMADTVAAAFAQTYDQDGNSTPKTPKKPTACWNCAR